MLMRAVSVAPFPTPGCPGSSILYLTASRAGTLIEDGSRDSDIRETLSRPDCNTEMLNYKIILYLI